MDALGISIFDLVVIAIIIFGGLTGLITGFLRGGLFVLSWIGAILATLRGFPLAQPIARQYIENSFIADLAAGTAVFLISLVILHLISHLLSGWVRGSRLNALDRTLGLVAGLATATFILGAAYLALVTPQNEPTFMRGAKVLPLIESAALVVRRLTPANIQERFGVAIEESRRELNRVDETRRAFERLATPPPTRTRSASPGYKSGERGQLDSLIEGNQ